MTDKERKMNNIHNAIREIYGENVRVEIVVTYDCIDAMPVVRGEWTTNSDYPDTVICSLCGWRESVWWADKGTNYCPNCGAKMEDKP